MKDECCSFSIIIWCFWREKIFSRLRHFATSERRWSQHLSCCKMTAIWVLFEMLNICLHLRDFLVNCTFPRDTCEKIKWEHLFACTLKIINCKVKGISDYYLEIWRMIKIAFHRLFQSLLLQTKSPQKLVARSNHRLTCLYFNASGIRRGPNWAGLVWSLLYGCHRCWLWWQSSKIWWGESLRQPTDMT